jgi:hypothetical protein
VIECSELLLGPWLAANRSASRKVWNVTNDTIGSIERFTPGWAWISRPRFEIREGDDRSLLFSICPRSWVRRHWLVYDADEQLVGALIRHARQRSIQALKPTAVPMGELSWPAAVTAAKAVSPRGAWLCDVRSLGTNVRISFASQIDPFSRMVLLAATLVAGA